MKRRFDFGRVARALHFAPFRWWMIGRFAASATIHMRSVAQGWLIYHLTGSALSLGWVRIASSLVMALLSPLGGLFADRIERRTILIWARVVMTASSFIIAWLIFTGRVQVWHMAMSAILDAAVLAFMMPAQDTIYPELVDRETLLNAISLDAVVGGLMGIIGATAAGFLIEAVSAGGVYIGLALLFVFAGFTHFQLPKRGKRKPEQKSHGKQTGLIDGVRYLVARPVLIAVVVLGLVRMLFIRTANTFMPVYAKDDLSLSASGLGLLTSFMTAGGLLTSLMTAGLGDTRHKGRLLLLAGFGAGAALIGMSLISKLPLPYILILLLGGALTAGTVIQNTVLQTHVDPAYRGRVNSLARAISAISPLWMLPAGILTDRFGAPMVFGIQGVAVLVAYLVVAISKPKLRQLD
jgi:MFS family permease